MTRFALSLPLILALAVPASAEPDARAIAQALHNALGGDGVPVEAIEPEGCETVPGQPGYDCRWSINLCVAEGVAGPCDNPGVTERAIFVGGDNGWLALDIRSPEDRAPRIPLDPSSPMMMETSEYWLSGTWNFEGNCENDGGFMLEADGRYWAMGEAGRWTLDGEQLVITVTDAEGEGGDLQPLETPSERRWTVYWMGQNAGAAVFADGSHHEMIRC
ncbi:hypothetical protein [Parasphingopyxis marina]|uniref:Protease inhibitor Inh n=1 Tax=Parasphingopyxis marina TaxID=2761622 RepID=A0A842I271_9SPHN|nr:hypothetical protein [Parasphingopyxis marina]MBC2779077.1 hypothetical protein [Parasphingopyxis marina]